MEDKILILRNSVNDYFFSCIAQEYNIHSVYYNKIEYYLFKMLSLFHLNHPRLLFGWKRRVKLYKKIIIFDYGWQPEITTYIKKYNSNCKIHLFFFNVIENSRHKSMLKDDNIDKYWTFDLNDAQKYNINFNSPMYTKRIANFLCESIEIKTDIVFVGKAKNREQLIKDIEKQCINQGLATEFKIIKTEKDYIKYMDYLKLVMKSKCILDITNKNQRGLTLRFMEALFLSKKLITNNIDIVNYSFYNPNNIFVLGMNNYNMLFEFISTPFIKCNEEDLDYYDMKEWINRFV